jgi:hypothetical protein
LWAQSFLLDLDQQLHSPKEDSGVQQKAAADIAALKKELADSEVARKEALTDAEVCSKAAQELKDMIDQLLAKTPPLEFQVQTLSSSLEDSAAEIRAKVLSLERTTAAKDDYKKKNSRLRKKLEGKFLLSFQFWPLQLLKWLYALFCSIGGRVEGPQDYGGEYREYLYASPRADGRLSDSIPRDNPEEYVEGIESDSGHPEVAVPRADLVAAGEGFAATCIREEAEALVVSFLDMADKIVEMIPPVPL